MILSHITKLLHSAKTDRGSAGKVFFCFCVDWRLIAFLCALGDLCGKTNASARIAYQVHDSAQGLTAVSPKLWIAIRGYVRKQFLPLPGRSLARENLFLLLRPDAAALHQLTDG